MLLVSQKHVPAFIKIPFFFLTDIVCFALLAKPIISFVLCAYACSTLKRTSLPLFFMLALATLLESFLYSGVFGTPLFYLIPIALLGTHIRHLFYDTALNRAMLLAACLITHAVCSPQPFALGALFMPYTYLKIFANIIIMMIFF